MQAGSAGGAGATTLGDGTGWKTFDAKAIWKPGQGTKNHTVTFGYHYDHYTYSSAKYAATTWTDDSSIGASPASATMGDTRTDAVIAQDAWKLDPRLTLTLGWRTERWQAFNGFISGYAPIASRDDTYHSPKASLAWRAANDWLIRGSVARAYRMPTVTELFQTEKKSGTTYISDPNLNPEKILATDLTAEHALRNGNLRLSLFDQHTDNFLTSQLNLTTLVNRVQNIGRTRITGAEAVYEATDFLMPGLDINGNLTYTDSEILSDPGNPAIVGKKVPRIPDWRASIFATYRFDEHWTGSLGLLYSGLQFGNLDNSDTNHNDTGSLSQYTTVDVKLGYRFSKLIRASFGIDNLTNENYFIGPHPFPQRTYQAELRMDY